MATDLKGIIKYAANHPGIFAAGVGLANGFLAYARNKKIDPKTAVSLSVILGLGETVLIAFEPEHERGPYSLTSVAVWSVVGVLAGVAPFVTPHPAPGETARPVLIAATELPSTATTAAVGSYGRRRRRR